jgi:ribonuclease T1
MRRAVVVVLVVALALAVGTALWHRDPGGGRSGAPPAPGAVTGEASAPAATASTASKSASQSGRPGSPDPAALAQARDVLAAIEARHGQPLAGHVGGRVFHNREGQLPAGRYREYDVHPRIPGRDRGPERLVINQATGRAYYSADHYRTFVPLN